MNVEEIIKKYAYNKEHLYETSRLALLLFNKLKVIFNFLEKYDNKKDLKLLYYACMLHDIGIRFENIYNLPHHKAGAKFILNNKPDEINEEDLYTLACLVRYHRKSLPNDKKHKIYSSLNEENKTKVNFLGSIVKLADALDCSHIGLVFDFDFEFDKKLNLLTLYFKNNIMLDSGVYETLNKKKDFFEKSFSLSLRFKNVT